MKDIKKMLGWFTPDRYEEEEKFLTKMSLKGWHFVELRGLIYYFEKGKATNYIYKLDYKTNCLEDKSNYQTIHQDCGWDHIFELRVFQGAWEYFRKESSADEDGDDLFSDNDSKIELLIRIRRFYTILAFILLASLGINYFNMFLWSYRYMMSREYFMMAFFFLFPSTIILLYLKILIRLSFKIKKLKGI